MRPAGALLIAVLLLACPAAAATTAQEHLDQGTVYDYQGQYDRALESYEQGLALEPDNALLWWAKGRVLKIQGRYAEAAAAYNRSTRLDPSLVQAHDGERAALEALANATSPPTAPATTPAAGLPWWAAAVTIAGAAGIAARGRRRR